MSPSSTNSSARLPVSCPQCKNPCDEASQYCPSCGFPVGAVPKKSGDKFIGTTLPAGYHILELIGVGGMGRVYRAEQSVLGRTVAVKIIHPHLLADENSAARFLTEARAASQMNHPNSISVFDFGRTDDGQPYLVMELLRGRDLGVVEQEDGQLGLGRIVEILQQVLAALGEAHELGIVHRDLKPENIILQPQRRGGDLVKVLDFGLAKLRADAPGSSVTSPGIVCGTPDYMAPEQGRGDTIDGRSDLYAVGVILFQLLTGRLPFEGESPTQVVMMHLSVPAPDPRQSAPRRGIPAKFAEVVKRALAKAPDDRYPDAAAFSDALEDALASAQGTVERPINLTSAAPSLSTGELIECEACGYQVPRARYCCECAAPLPQDRSAQFPIPFTGRSEELSWLESRRPTGPYLAGARIAGEAGSGKTRLLEEFAQSVSAQGDQVVLVSPDPYGARVALHAVGSAVRTMGRLNQEMIDAREYSRAGAEAQRGLNDLFHPPSHTRDIRSPMERRHSIAAALRWALVEAAARGPGMPVLIVDEMERMDGPSLHAFADLMGDPPAIAALLVGAHAPGFESGWGAELTAARVLSGLEPQYVRALGQVGFSPPKSELVLPLYLDQALRHHFEGGTDIPERMGDLIHHRLDMLDADARRVLQGLSVLGFSAVISDVAELVRIDGVEDAISTLLVRGMITVSGGRAQVSHPLIRHVTLSVIPAEARRQLHRRALRIEDRGRGPLEARAQHAYECQESFQALLLLEQVADRATAVGDTDAEVLALRKGLEVARKEISRGELDDPMRAVLIFSRKLGASLTRAGNFSDADGVLRESLDLAGPTSPDRAKILGALAHVSYGRRRYDEALARLEQAISAARSAGAESLRLTLEDTRDAWTT
jgi:serine/threonine protein kinase